MGTGSLYAFDRSVKTQIADGVTVNGVDVGGLTPQARAREAQRRAAGAARPPGQRALPGPPLHAHAGAGADRGRHRRLGRPRAGRLARGQPAHAHLARGPRRGARRQGRGEDLVVACGGPQGRAARPRQAHDRAARRRGRPRVRRREPGARRATAVPSTRAASGATSRPSCSTPATRGSRACAPRWSSRRSPRRSSPRSIRRSWSSTAAPSSYALQGPQAGQDVRHRGRPDRPRDPAGLYHIQNKADQPGLERPELRLGGRPRRHRRSRRHAAEPAQGALAGDLRRRRHPRHRRLRLDRQRRLARLHPDADPGRDRALRPGAVGAPIYIA